MDRSPHIGNSNKTMNTDIFIKKIIGISSSKKKITCAPPLASPARDWGVLLFCVGLLLCIAVFFAGSTYMSVKRGPEKIEKTGFASARASQLNESGLARILTLRDARAKLHEEYLRGL